MKKRTSGKLMAMLLVLSMIVSLFPVGAVAATIEPVPGDKTEIVSPDTEPPAEGEVKPSETSPVETSPVETPPVETPPVETPPAETPPAEVPVEKPENALKVEPLAGSATGTPGDDGRTILLIDEGDISISANAVTVGGKNVTPNAMGYIIQDNAATLTTTNNGRTVHNVRVEADTTTTIVLDNVDVRMLELANSETCNVTLLLKGTNRISSQVFTNVYENMGDPVYGDSQPPAPDGIKVLGRTTREASSGSDLGAVTTAGAHMTIRAIDGNSAGNSVWGPIIAPGHLTIESGTVIAKSCGYIAMAIRAGDLHITGTAVVNAESGRNSAGIGILFGSGDSANIRIDGAAHVTAMSGGYSAAIGASYRGKDCGDILIEGNAVVIANGRTEVGPGLTVDQGSPAIGGGIDFGIQGKITIGGSSDVTATASGSNSAAIGGSTAGTSNLEIVIKEDTTVTAKGSGNGAGIEAGKRPEDAVAVTISGGTVNASGGANGGAGIGGSGNREPGLILITDGTITAVGGNNSAGIGGNNNHGGGDITISGGDITASGGNNGAGIGGGNGGTNGGNIDISGGNINVSGGNNGAGIGGGNDGNSGNITIGDGVTIGGITPGTGGAGVGGGNGGLADLPNIKVPDTIKPGNGTSKVITTEVTLYIDKDNIVIGPNFVSGKDATGTKVTTPTTGSYTITQTNPAVKTNNTITFRGGYMSGTTNAAEMKTSGYITLSSVNCGAIILAEPSAEENKLFGKDDIRTLHISFYGDSKVTGVNGQAGIVVPQTHTLLTSRADYTYATLTARGGANAAGIGGNDGMNSGAITIGNGIKVNAIGGVHAAGIGGGRNGTGSNILVKDDAQGGTAQGGAYGAGIGGGLNATTGNTNLINKSPIGGLPLVATAGTPAGGAAAMGNGGKPTVIPGVQPELDIGLGNIDITAASGGVPASASINGVTYGSSTVGFAIVGTSMTNLVRILGAGSVDVTLRNVEMSKTWWEGQTGRGKGLITIGYTGDGDNVTATTLNLMLEGTNKLYAVGENVMAIAAPKNTSLVVTGKGTTAAEKNANKLRASSGLGYHPLKGQTWRGEQAVIGWGLNGTGSLTFRSGIVEVFSWGGNVVGIGGSNGARIHITDDAVVTANMWPRSPADISLAPGIGLFDPMHDTAHDDLQITIDGNAVVEAHASKWGSAAIGYGADTKRTNANTPTKGKITIGGTATVTAMCDIYSPNSDGPGMGAAIGGGGKADGDCPEIIIRDNPTIIAKNPANEANKTGGPGIGGSNNVRVTISGGTIEAVGAPGAAGIGGLGGTIDITGGHITATGGAAPSGTFSGGAGVGGSGLRLADDTKVTGAITISGSPTIIAKGGDGDGAKPGGSGIGKGNGEYSTVSISGTPTITADGGAYGAGIGSGGDKGSITIDATSGTIAATGGTAAAGIGGGNAQSGGVITISGGSVLTIKGGINGAGIGGGMGASNKTISVLGVTGTVAGGKNAADIGGGVGGKYIGDQDGDVKTWPAGLTGTLTEPMGGINTNSDVNTTDFAALLIDHGNVTMKIEGGIATGIQGKALSKQADGSYTVIDKVWSISEIEKTGILITTEALARAGLLDFQTPNMGDVTGTPSANIIDLTGAGNKLIDSTLNPALHVPIVLWGVNASQFKLGAGDEVHIALKGNNRFKGANDKAGIEAPVGSNLTIHTFNDEINNVPTLLVEGGTQSAGIGGSLNLGAGDIVLESGAKAMELIVKGGTGAPGIGAGVGSAENGTFSAGNKDAAAGSEINVSAKVYADTSATGVFAIPAAKKDVYADAMVAEFNAGDVEAGTLSGSVTTTVAGANLTKVVATLYRDGVARATGIADESGNFTIKNAKVGTYKLVITRPGYTKYTIEALVVTAEKMDLTARNLKLYAGDLDGDDIVGLLDFNALIASNTYDKSVAEAVQKMADLDDDGVIGFIDFNILINSNNYGKESVKVSN